MVSSVINRKGVVRTNELTRTNEFIYFVKFGSARLAAEREHSKEKVRWASLRRFEDSSRRNGPQPRPDQFYPIFVGAKSGRIESVGTSLSAGVDRSTVAGKPGCLTVWPLKPDGTEMIWGTNASHTQKTPRGRFRESHSRQAGQDTNALLPNKWASCRPGER